MFCWESLFFAWEVVWGNILAIDILMRERWMMVKKQQITSYSIVMGQKKLWNPILAIFVLNAQT